MGPIRLNKRNYATSKNIFSMHNYHSFIPLYSWQNPSACKVSNIIKLKNTYVVKKRKKIVDTGTSLRYAALNFPCQ